MKRTLLLAAAAAAACGFALSVTPGTLVAQNAPAQPAQPTQQPPAGLDALTDDKVIADLERRGLANLLNRAYEVNNIPPQQRGAGAGAARQTAVAPAGIAAALQRLADPKLTLRERDALIPQVVKAIELALPALSDPKTLAEYAEQLRRHGVEREVSLLEYWGETARSQAPLRPTVEAVIKLLDKAAEIAQKQADALANQIGSPNDPRAQKWEQLAGTANAAKFTRHMMDYYLALSMDRVASQQRKEVAATSAEYLAQFDSPDSTVQPQVRIQLAKLHMVRDEFPQAKEIFATIIDDKEVEPKPDVWQQWEARYFSAVSDLLGGDVAAAQKGLNDLIAWQRGSLPNDKASQDRAAAAASMLQYRIHALAADTAPSPAAKAKANEQAVTVLLDLVNRRPDLRTVIYRQLLTKLPADVDLKTLDPLLLQAIVARADEERLRPETEQADAAVLQRGVDAAREILRQRRAATTTPSATASTIDPQTLEADALLIGFFLERLGQRAAAAEAFLDYLRDFGPTAANAAMALDNALILIGRLRADAATATDPATIRAYERVLPVAINPPFNRKEFAYEYARQLQTTGKAKEALEYFRQVPPNDRRAASARYYEMVALQQRLDNEKLAPAERRQVVAEVLRRVDEVTKQLTAGLNAARDEQERLRYRSMLASTTLLAADVARRELGDPKRTLQLLEPFEQVAQGLPNERDLIGTVLYTRVQSYMQLGDSDAATRTLVALLKSKPGGEGAAIVYNLLQKLNQELDAARTNGQRDRMLVLARNRAQLSGFLVDWARNNPDENIRRYTYKYSVFDADTKHLAASLEEDPAARKAGLQQALELYRKLEAPESVELYRETLEPNSPERNSPDPAVSLGIGLIAYDLGDYAEAQRRLGTLLTERKLGTPTIASQDESGQTKVVENDQYWEATLKLMRSNLALAAANLSDANAQAAKEETINYLKQLYVRWGRDVGGKRWSGEFEKLRAETIPRFNPDEIPLDAPSDHAAGANESVDGEALKQ